jgi:hypothetical protein
MVFPLTNRWSSPIAVLVIWTSLSGSAAAQPAAPVPSELPVVNLDGDVTIAEPTTWENAHYRVAGNIVLQTGGELTVRQAVVEILNTYSRQYALRWEGGTLVTDHVLLGGTKDGQGIRQSNLELLHGRWQAVDTQVRYVYGITFDPTGQRQGELHATRLTGGENSDSVIMNGNADVTLVDSEYDISLTMQAVGGTARYALPIDQPLTTIIDSAAVPGAAYRLELIRTKVSLWFLFVGGTAMDGPATTVLLEDCPRIILSVMGGNLQGHWHLPAVLRPALFDRDVTVGNVTFRTARPTRIPAWGVYLWGAGTDVTLRGPTTICELMLAAGKVTLQESQPGARDAEATLTTVDVGAMWDVAHGDAQLMIRGAQLGRRDGFRGQMTAHRNGRIEVVESLIRSADIIARAGGTVLLRDVELVNSELLPDGGKIELAEPSRSPE